MKKPTHKLSVQRAFSLVELLVVIAVIAVIAAIAIPNIAGITGAANAAKAKRNAQNIASVASAARAAGWTKSYGGTNDWVPDLKNGSIVNSVGTFRIDGLSDEETTAALVYITYNGSTSNSMLLYNPQ